MLLLLTGDDVETETVGAVEEGVELEGVVV